MAYVSEKREIPAARGDRLALGLPVVSKDKRGGSVHVDLFDAQRDGATVRNMLNEAIRDGETYPYFSELDEENFRAYFGPDAFVIRDGNGADDGPHGPALGAFYVKPNFPGRCSDICNAGFVVATEHRGRGLCSRLAEALIPLARTLGYRAIMFNLVFATNKPSLHLWKRLGFTQIGIIPRAGRLRGHPEPVDAHMWHYDLEKSQS
jgi:GNAT superfamily N-acetyltransferase